MCEGFIETDECDAVLKCSLPEIIIQNLNGRLLLLSYGCKNIGKLLTYGHADQLASFKKVIYPFGCIL